jgi:YHS domain-containing protein
VFRAILYLIVFIVAVSRGAPPSQPGMESLHKDPVCGTFVAPSTAWQKVSSGKTYYFCSTHCRDQFKG